MIVDDLYFACSIFFPDEADSVLFVDSDAVLTGPVSFQSFQLISGRNTKVGEVDCDFDLIELA